MLFVGKESWTKYIEVWIITHRKKKILLVCQGIKKCKKYYKQRFPVGWQKTIENFAFEVHLCPTGVQTRQVCSIYFATIRTISLYENNTHFLAEGHAVDQLSLWSHWEASSWWGWRWTLHHSFVLKGWSAVLMCCTRSNEVRAINNWRCVSLHFKDMTLKSICCSITNIIPKSWGHQERVKCSAETFFGGKLLWEKASNWKAWPSPGAAAFLQTLITFDLRHGENQLATMFRQLLLCEWLLWTAPPSCAHPKGSIFVYEVCVRGLYNLHNNIWTMTPASFRSTMHEKEELNGQASLLQTEKVE